MFAERGLAVLRIALSTTALLTALPFTASAEAKAPSPGERIASALRSSPVYVDPVYEKSVPPARQDQLARRIARTGLPIKVVLTPLIKGDSFNGDSAVLAEVVHDRLAQRDLVLITTDGEFTDSLNGYEWPGDAHQARDAVAAVGFLDEMEEAGPAERTAKAIELVEQGDGTKAYEEATSDLDSGSGSGPTSKSPSDNSTSQWRWPTLIAIPALAAAAALGLLLFVRRRSRHSRRSRRGSSFMYPHTVFAAARAADEAEVRRRAEAEVLDLGEAVRSTDPSDSSNSPASGLQRALDAYAAAGTVLDTSRGLPDLAGVLALTAEGRDALDAVSAPLPLCFFNPLHGRAADRLDWRALGRRDSLRVAACPTCAEAVRLRRAPEVLTDTAEDGRRVPYFEVSNSFWATTGYGSLLADEDGDGGANLDDGADGSLALRVGRGEFRGTSRSRFRGEFSRDLGRR
ncbi:hypothetical protein FHS35_007251 [Streptomyces umbrinus]|uniref:hypothetical protein n=1 Tax=Streptomyces umbrinus TaxID=67370 RepID=UPI00167EDD8B|nr:hypothetical protein [Streptomyces umbrinus]MCR3730364.1 hypothetical protein [Streptomyces umbrinus]GHH58205.1 hypothetical protein GCM10018775_67460 [Streptomyces umbrinus]